MGLVGINWIMGKIQDLKTLYRWDIGQLDNGTIGEQNFEVGKEFTVSTQNAQVYLWLQPTVSQ